MFVEYEVKKSRFLAYVVSIDEFEKRLQELKKKHKKARHFVWAYRYEEDGVLKEKKDDDGEPSGSSGSAVLNVLQKKDILGYAVIVVRYFGGVKLGFGGLVRAYSKSASLALERFFNKSLKSSSIF